jgi:hypothetical protein
MVCPPQPNVGPRPNRVVSDGGVASVLGSTTAPTEPPDVGRIPMTMGYLRMYALDMAPTGPPSQAETLRTYKRRVYNTMHETSTEENITREMRVTQVRPYGEWALVWKNLHSTRVYEEAKTVWYIVIHDLQ